MISRRVFVGSAWAAARLRGADESLLWSNVAEIPALLRSRKITASGLTQLCLDRIQKRNARLNAFVTLTAERALADAGKLDAEAQAGKFRGPLHGVPIGLKDLYDTAGVLTTAASKQWSGRVPDRDAEVVRRLRAAGAIILGKLNMDEFAYNFTGETSSFGASRNPWDVRRSPGGSSGGSAVAVAAGLCFAALGSDTGGSIRLPAALCGITGLKPTYGVGSTAGVAPLAWSLDHVGPMCRTAQDAALMLEAMTGKPLNLAAVNVRSLKLGVPRTVFYEALDPEVAKIVAEATRALGSIAASVRDIALPPMEKAKDSPMFPEAYMRILLAEAYTFHQEMLNAHPDRYHPGTREMIKLGAPVRASDYIRASREMERMRGEADRAFGDRDLLITPTAPGPAFEFGRQDLVYLRNTAPWNLLGLPTISIPCGFTSRGLPVGLQISGKAGRDHAVLALAAAYQKTTEWHRRHPAESNS